MKPKPILTILLALSISGGLLWAFPTLWMAMVLVLLALLAGQMTLIRRSIKVVRADQSGPPLRMSRTAASAALTPAFANQDGTPAKPTLDPAAFARFRAHLETVEHERGIRSQVPAASERAPASAPQPESKALSAARAGVPSVAEEGMAGESSAVADKVALSGTAAAGSKPTPAAPKVKSATTYGPQRRVVMPGAKPKPQPKGPAAPPPLPVPPAPDEADGPDLFADLRPNASGTLPARSPVPVPAAADELGAQLKAAPAEEPHADEAAAVLKIAQEALHRGDLGGARAGLEQHLGLLPAEEVTWQARRLQVKVCALGNEPQRALDAFDAMTKAGFTVKVESVAPLVDELLDGVSGDMADSLRVSLLLKILAVFRQATDRQAMDLVYRLIIEAQERVGDERKLVQFLKNYLEIKKIMGEIPGQLDLIDQIGNRLFKLGDTAEAREFYELGLKIRADQQDAELTSSSAKTGTTPQTA